MNIRGVIFDKDGTLFDFQSTWGIWTAQVLARIAGSDEALLQQLAEALGYDTQTRRVQPGSVIVAATPMDIAAVVKDCIPALSQAQICEWLNEEAKTAPQVLVTDMHRLTAELRRINLGLCVMTNDAEAPARAHLASPVPAQCPRPNGSWNKDNGQPRFASAQTARFPPHRA